MEMQNGRHGFGFVVDHSEMSIHPEDPVPRRAQRLPYMSNDRVPSNVMVPPFDMRGWTVSLKPVNDVLRLDPVRHVSDSLSVTEHCIAWRMRCSDKSDLAATLAAICVASQAGVPSAVRKAPAS